MNPRSEGMTARLMKTNAAPVASSAGPAMQNERPKERS
jgi:hypothetical protein